MKTATELKGTGEIQLDRSDQSKVLKGLGCQNKKSERASRDSKKPLVDLQQDSDMTKVPFNISLIVVCKIDQSGREITYTRNTI